MYNYKSSKQVKTDTPIVTSFDISEDVGVFQCGIKKVDQNGNENSHSLRVLKNKTQWFVNGTQSFQIDGQFNIIYNIGDKLFDNDYVIIQNEQLNDYYYIKSQIINGYNNFSFIDNNQNQIQFEELNLHHNAFVFNNVFNTENEQIYRNGYYYYNTPIQVIPVTIQCNNDQTFYIVLQSQGEDATLLICDYGIKSNPKQQNISTICSIVNGQVTNTNYICNTKYDRVRFVLSDYTRIMSFSTHKIQSNKSYQDSEIITLDVDKIYNPVIVTLSVDNKQGITNITSNF